MNPKRAVTLLSRDRVLRTLLEAELSALGAVLHCSESDPQMSGTVLLLIDLDSAPPITKQFALPVIGITRRACATLSPQERDVCTAILHRPFPIESLRALLLPYFGEAHPHKYRLLSAHRKTKPLPSKPLSSQAEERITLTPSADGTAIQYGAETIPLTPGEAEIFRALYEANGAPVPKSELLRCLGTESAGNLPEVHVCAIRKKLASLGLEAALYTYRKKGYALLR